MQRMSELMKICNKFMLRRTSTVLKELLPTKVEQVSPCIMVCIQHVPVQCCMLLLGKFPARVSRFAFSVIWLQQHQAPSTTFELRPAYVVGQAYRQIAV